MDIRRGKTPTVRVTATTPMVAPTAEIRTHKGVLIASPSATPSPIDTTVVADDANTADGFLVAGGTGIGPGADVVVSDPSWGDAEARVSALDGARVILVQPLPGVPDAGAVVRGLNVFVVLPLAATSELARAHKLIVTDGDEAAELVFNVCEHPIVGCRAVHVRTMLAKLHASELLDEQECHDIAETVHDEIRGHLLTSGAFLDAYWDPKVVQYLRRHLIERELGQGHGLWAANRVREVYEPELEAKIVARVEQLLKSGEPYDTNGDGAIEPAELGGVFVTKMVR